MASPALTFLTDAQELPRDHVAMVGTFPFRPTLFLGLGGTGSQAVAKEKELFLKLVAPQMHAGLNARIADINPLYAFCAFDTNVSERPQQLDAGTEWHHLAVENMVDFYENKGRTPFYEPWLVKHFPVSSLGSGAGGFRNLGRLAFMHNISTINGALIDVKDQITRAAAGINVVTATPLIHIFCSLSGGTGSGMLLDACFLLRTLMPGVKIIGHIAILDGLPQLTTSARNKIRVNTFCALKELNAFMSGLSEAVGQRISYSNTISARTTAPLDHCFLLGSYRNDGASSLPEQRHLASFMARVAFMISGYSFRPDDRNNTPDFSGVMVNNDRMTEVEGGAHACYMIPGFAQAHFPVNDTATLFTCIKARECLKYLRGGTAREGNREAANFFAQNTLDSGSIRDAIGHDPRDDQHSLLAAPTYDRIIGQLFDSGKPAEHREQILGFANAIPSARLAEIMGVLRPNIDSLRRRIEPAVRAAAAGYFENDEYLGLGAAHFLSDLKALVETEYNLLQANAMASVEAEYADLPRKWNSLQPQVVDAVTTTGMIDRFRDWYNRTEVRNLYTEYLNRAETVLLEKARTDLAKEFYTGLLAQLGAMTTALSRLLNHDLPDAILEFSKNEVNYSTSLCAQDNAEDASVENIRSFNVMTDEWRRTYLLERSLPPASVLSNLLKTGWHPMDLLDAAPPQGVAIGKQIAHTLFDLVTPLFDEVRRWHPVDVLRNNAKMARISPADMISRIYSTLLQPQLQISGMKSRTNIDLDSIVFTGGITEEFKAELQASGKFANVTFNVADNQETGRLNFTSVTLPVALAGCDLAWKNLESHYNSWRGDLGQTEGAQDEEDQVARFHCFPGSPNWPSPVRHSTGHDTMKVTFARALAVSEIIQPSRGDLDKMNTTSKTPKDKRYALFQVGDSQFWLWPFFAPNDTSATIAGTPVTLGTNVVDAFDAFSKSVELQKHARNWVEWLQNHWSDEHSGEEIRTLRDKALHSFSERKGRTAQPDRKDLWDEIASITSEWTL